MAERKKTEKPAKAAKTAKTERPKAERKAPAAKRPAREAQPKPAKPQKAPRAEKAPKDAKPRPVREAAVEQARAAPSRRRARVEAGAIPAAAAGHAPLFATDGTHRGDHALPAALFAAPTSGAVVHQAVTAALANARQGTATTRSRSEVAGGGAKPWRQKGTGRARQGSIRAPHWRHGAVVFGPNGRVYDQRLPRKMRRLALAAALSAAARDARVLVVEDLEVADGRTRSAQDLLTRIGVEGDALVVATPAALTARAFRNLETVAMVAPAGLRLVDVLAADRIVFAKSALDELAGRTPGATEEPAP